MDFGLMSEPLFGVVATDKHDAVTLRRERLTPRRVSLQIIGQDKIHVTFLRAYTCMGMMEIATASDRFIAGSNALCALPDITTLHV